MIEPEPTWTPDWPICSLADCIGIRMERQGTCLSHAPPKIREAFLHRLEPGADVDLRGTPIDPELLAQILVALTDDTDDDHPLLGRALFERAHFTAGASFDRVRFSSFVSFAAAQFSDSQSFRRAASFRRAQFRDAIVLDQAQFHGPAEFLEAQFGSLAQFLQSEFRAVSFDGVQFTDKVWFDGAQFAYAQFQDTRFRGNVSFDRATFSGEALLEGAEFTRRATFQGTRFKGHVDFDSTQFRRSLKFDRTRFRRSVSFREAQFSRGVVFDKVHFGQASFENARFSGGVTYNEVQFNGLVQFTRAQLCETARFYRTQFKQAGTLGPIFAGSSLVFDRVAFEQDMLIEIVGSALACTASRFAETVTLRLRHTDVVLDGTVFAKPSTLALAPDTFKSRTSSGAGEEEAFDEQGLAGVEGRRSPRPRLLSLRGVDVATLTLSEVDLAACLVQGAHRLDQLRIEGARPFADTPAAWRLHIGRWQLPVWRRWTQRQTLAEEHHWRSERRPLSQRKPGRLLWLTRPAWHEPTTQTPDRVTEATGQHVHRLGPDRLAVLYRALRKAQEDNKDEPGAADFYYGEMEMRRHDPSKPWAERAILTAYWLVSGYALRASRALVALLAVVLLATLIFASVGFAPTDPVASRLANVQNGSLQYERVCVYGEPQQQGCPDRPKGWQLFRTQFWDSLVFSAESTTSLLRTTTQRPLNTIGEWTRVALRLLGALLFALAVLSIRGRVKR